MISEALHALAAFPRELALALHGIDEVSLRKPERDGAWSVLQVVTHLRDFQVQTLWRTRAIVASDEPPLPKFDGDAWVNAAGELSKKELLSEFNQLTEMNVRFLRTLTEAQLARTGRHADYGLLTLRDLLIKAVDHQRGHLGQIERIKSTLGLSAKAMDATADSVVAAQAPGRTLEGIRVRNLWRDGVRHAQLVEIDAGAAFPAIDHHVPGPEEVYVVSGVFDDGAKQYEAGTFIHYPAASSHVPQSKTGCSLFLFYPEG